MEVVELPLAGLLLLKPRVFADDRGFFLETWRADAAAPGVAFVQDNHSRSAQHTVRGLHFQRGPGQAKLVRAARGRIFDVAVDIRPASPTYRRWHAEILDDDKHHQLFVPVGFAHGFCVLSDVADVCYRVSTRYDAALETGFRWDDPAGGVAWPVDAARALLSARDKAAPMLAEVTA